MIKPIDIARKLNISTSALRHYESWGIVPKAERAANGYRIYTEVHAAYFECIRSMSTGFGMEVVRKVMPLIHENKVADALWIVNNVQVNLFKEKQKAEQAMKVLSHEELEKFDARNDKKWYTIKEAAEEIGVTNSTLRHWEKERLIVPKRDQGNGYRMYSQSDLRKLLIIRTLRTAVYSLDIVRNVLKEVDHNSISHAIKIVRDSLFHMDNLIKEQLRGQYYLYKLCEIAGRQK
ncbi:MerR family transcriptional regulator [Virgibacillus oceani]|uniref:MerR family transcriptional regulator n=1 Tax=Virgibacillus oceani TaxID=1479511 RepID=A0A917HJ33_9BACI|nr:MerR family transcriptional regulator [Virgibacillus oceani]GGG80305.1 MerR family transcriptional regulator [Virgibacillus oceani]